MHQYTGLLTFPYVLHEKIRKKTNALLLLQLFWCNKACIWLSQLHPTMIQVYNRCECHNWVSVCLSANFIALKCSFIPIIPCCLYSSKIFRNNYIVGTTEIQYRSICSWQCNLLQTLYLIVSILEGFSIIMKWNSKFRQLCGEHFYFIRVLRHRWFLKCIYLKIHI